MNSGVKTRKAKNCTKHYFEVLERHLNKHSANEVDSLANKIVDYNTITSHLSEEIDEAKKFIAQLLILADDAASSGSTTRTLPPTPPPPPTCTTVAQPSLPGPVTFLKFDFSEFDVQSVCRDVKFRKIGQRQTAFFGKTEYRYGNIIHKPCDYPDNHLLGTIIDKISGQISDPTFNMDNITCLLTLYENGKSNIPMHSDNEPCIATTSDIVTVSLGASRKIQFCSKVGRICTQDFDLNHGQVYSMSRHSQDFWEHSIPPDHTIQGQRLSLTFRRLTPPANPQHIPPIHQSSRPAVDPTPPPTERVLLLTDSIHATTPTSIFPQHLPCTKETMFQLTDLHKFEHLFPHMKYVVISSGINDLSRFDHRSYSLFDAVSKDLRTFCEKYQDTTFIFNSILLTQYHWLSPEICRFNELMLEFSTKINNLWLFDSHQICRELTGSRFLILDPNGNGIHLSLAANR